MNLISRLMVGISAIASVSNASEPLPPTVTELGNGGVIVVCDTAKAELAGGKAVLLDHYEGAQIYGFTLDLGDVNLKVRDKIDLIISKLEHIDPYRFKLYSEYHDDFWKTARFGIYYLPKLADDGIVPLPGADCQIVQAAIQKDTHFPGRSRYTVDQRKWDLLDANSQAGLVLHEIIFREAIDFGHKNAEAVRYFNSLISSPEFSKMSRESYGKSLNEIVYLPAIYPHGDWVLDLLGLEFDDQNLLKAGRLKASKRKSLVIEPNQLVLHTGLTMTATGAKATFFENGLLKSLKSPSPLNMALYSWCYGPDGVDCVSPIAACTAFFTDEISFYSSGDVESFTGCNPAAAIWHTTEHERIEVALASIQRVSYYPGLRLKSAIIQGESQQVLAPDGQWITLKSGSYAEFDPQGYLLHGTLGIEASFVDASNNTRLLPQDSIINFVNGKLI